MTVTSQSTRKDHTAIAAQTLFPYDFVVYSETDLAVYSGGILRLLGSDYTVTNVGVAEGGNVVFNTAPGVGVVVNILSDIERTQQIAYPPRGSFPALAHEQALDKLTRLIQQLGEEVDRSLKLTPTDIVTPPGLVLTAIDNQFLKRAGNTIIGADITLPGSFLTTSEWANVKDFGAVSGGANSTTAVQAAANSLSAGGTLYYPKGTWIHDDITLFPGTHVMGAAKTVTLIKARSNNNILFKYAAAATVAGFSFSGFTIDANGKTGVTGIKLDGTDSAKRISGVWINNVVVQSAAKGIHLRFCANSFLHDSWAIACTEGFYQDQCADTNYSNCMAQSGTGYGFTVLGGGGAFDEGTRMVGCSTNGQGGGLLVSGQDWGMASACSFTTAPTLGAVALVNTDNWRFIGCDIAGTGAFAGINSDTNCSQISVIGCYIVLNTFGIVVKGANWTVTGNNLASNSNVDIQIDSATRCSVVGNNCLSNGVTQSINEAAAGGANYNTITGNNCLGTIVLKGAHSIAPTGSNLTVSDISGVGAPDAYQDLGAKNYKTPGIGAATNMFTVTGPGAAIFDAVLIELTTGGLCAGRGGAVVTTRYHVCFDNNVSVVTVLSTSATTGSGGAVITHSTSIAANVVTFIATVNGTAIDSKITSRILVTGSRCKIAVL